MHRPLTGKRVWLTRPAHQAASWAQALEEAGAEALCEPLLAIEPPLDAAAARRDLEAAETADVVIATSSNAVRSAWQLCPHFAPVGSLYGVGAASAAALAQASGRAVAQPATAFSSEQLLALPSLASLQDRRVLLLSGDGGRNVLADTLAARGADVAKLALYRRRALAIAPARLAELLGLADAIVVTSGEALSHLVTLAGSDLRELLADTLLVAPSMRVVKQSNQRLSWARTPIIVARVSGDGVVAALARAWRENGQ